MPTDLSSIHATCQPLPSATPWAWGVSTAAHTWGQGQHRHWDSGPSEQGMPGPGMRHRGLQVGGTQLEEGQGEAVPSTLGSISGHLGLKNYRCPAASSGDSAPPVLGVDAPG